MCGSVTAGAPVATSVAVALNTTGSLAINSSERMTMRRVSTGRCVDLRGSVGTGCTGDKLIVDPQQSMKDGHIKCDGVQSDKQHAVVGSHEETRQ